MENQPENDNSSNVETDDQQVEQGTDSTTEELDASALKAKLEETEAKNRQLFERAKKAEGFILKDGKWIKPEKSDTSKSERVEPDANTGELDETQLDYLDLKGISESEDIDIITSVMKRTGQTVRQALKDEYVVERLKANRSKREVANATPSGTKRGGTGGAMGVEAALAKYEATGELPTDFELRSAVINAKEAKESSTLPPWRR